MPDQEIQGAVIRHAQRDMEKIRGADADQPGLMKQLWDMVPRVGDGHVEGMARQGLKELAQVLPAFPDSMRTVEEPGVFGNPTQIEVTKERGYAAEIAPYANRPMDDQSHDQGFSR